MDWRTNPEDELSKSTIEKNESAIISIDGKIIAWEENLSHSSLQKIFLTNSRLIIILII